VSETSEEFVVKDDGNATSTFLLYDQPALEHWLSEMPETVYFDMTAIALRTWAPLLRAAISSGKMFRFVYVEPNQYPRAPDGSGGGFDISELTEGISAVPGFARIADSSNDPVPFVPLLGFEGGRLTRVIQKLEAPLESTFPILGVPGYRVEFPFHALAGNKRELAKAFVHTRVTAARANCPFDAFFELSRIHAKMGGSRLQVAPLGTKPHALGATLFAIARGAVIELVYDHPKRAARPSHGISRVCLYFVSEFMLSDAYGRSHLPGAA
jgi:hypothetical protein